MLEKCPACGAILFGPIHPCLNLVATLTPVPGRFIWIRKDSMVEFPIEARPLTPEQLRAWH